MVSKVLTRWQPGMTQLGIDLLWYANPTESIDQVSKQAETDMNYIVGLHANSVDIVFPFYTSSATSNATFAGSDTPTTTALAVAIQAATKAGLRVTLRPLMDQGSLGGGSNWRGNIHPSDVASWFTGYEQFLQPYLATAQANGVATFIVGAELSSLAAEPEWPALIAKARIAYHGELAYSSNFDVFQKGDQQPPVDRLGVDAYFPVLVSSDAPLTQLEAAWDFWWSTLPHSIKPSKVVIDELGIAAQNGAYQVPYNTDFTGEPINTVIQTNWFAAACQAVQQFHIAGIYFWNVDFGNPTEITSPSSIVERAGAQGIRKCFSSL
jgi:hypothetical protein